jgi:RNA polymerase sigma factor (sigma-70 family)
VTDPEQAAFAAACDEHRRMLRAHCYRMTGSLDDAEDLVQETLLRSWRARESFEGRSQPSTWLHRIATNVCLDALASRRATAPPSAHPTPRSFASRHGSRRLKRGVGASVSRRSQCIPRVPAGRAVDANRQTLLRRRTERIETKMRNMACFYGQTPQP